MTRARHVALWGALIFASVLFSAGLRRAGVPAALLIGPMLTGMAFALRGAPLRVPGGVFTVVKAIIGGLVAVNITPDTLVVLGRDWPVMVLAIAVIVAAGGVVGFLLLRLGVLPGTTAA
ncbi:MAG: AbrB family transcriptional regulator, partial [Desulfovibrionaceae bacterium]